jgi:hypothetical protein
MIETAQTWPLEGSDRAPLAAAVQGGAARWNVPGMTAAMLHAIMRSGGRLAERRR